MKTQHKFHFPLKSAASALHSGEIVVDLFAGGGGASEALRDAKRFRVDQLRQYGNAINPWQAAEFVRAYLDHRETLTAIKAAA